MLVPIRMGTNMAAGNQSKHLSLTSSIKAIVLSLQAGIKTHKLLSQYLNCLNYKYLNKRPFFFQGRQFCHGAPVMSRTEEILKILHAIFQTQIISFRWKLPRGDHKNLAGPVNFDFRSLWRHAKTSSWTKPWQSFGNVQFNLVINWNLRLGGLIVKVHKQMLPDGSLALGNSFLLIVNPVKGGQLFSAHSTCIYISSDHGLCFLRD